MRKKVLWSVFVLFSTVFFLVASSSATAVLSRLGISEEDTHEHVWMSLSYGYLSYPHRAEFKQIPAGERAAIISAIGTVARLYVQSGDFANRYADFREQSRPLPPESPASAGEQRLDQKRELEESIREAEANMKSLPEETRQIVEESLVFLREQLAALDDPDNPIFGSGMDDMLQEQYQADLQEFELELSQWEEEYPEDPLSMVEKRLEEFLNESTDVDFQAEVTRTGSGSLVFVDPDNEARSSNWKLCYRAGEETVVAARNFAQKWLAELRGGS